MNASVMLLMTEHHLNTVLLGSLSIHLLSSIRYKYWIVPILYSQITKHTQFSLRSCVLWQTCRLASFINLINNL